MSCGICMDDKSKKKLITLECNHEFHNVCLRDFINLKLSNRETVVKCPHVDKNGVRCNGDTPFNKAQNNKVGRVERSIFDCPLKINDKQCTGYVKRYNKRCTKCRTKFCSKCLKVSHDGECEKILVDGIDIKKCPNCKCDIFKDEGCDHIFCVKCKTHFDWNTMSTDEDKWNSFPTNINDNVNNVIQNNITNANINKQDKEITQKCITCDNVCKLLKEENCCSCYMVYMLSLNVDLDIEFCEICFP